jgi:hypothetical protein
LKSASLYSFSEDSVSFLSGQGALNIIKSIYYQAPCPDKNQPKVFGKGGMGERTFPQKGFSPIITRQLLYKHRPYRGLFYLPSAKMQ